MALFAALVGSVLLLPTRPFRWLFGGAPTDRP
jgi:hypothetical protein